MVAFPASISTTEIFIFYLFVLQSYLHVTTYTIYISNKVIYLIKPFIIMMYLISDRSP